jgi:hypothetical protein
MGLPRISVRWIAIALGALVVVSSCSGDESKNASTATTTGTDSGYTARAPEEITAPPAEGAGIVQPQPAAPLPDGYVEEEYLVGGTATRFDAVETPDDGFWTATPAEEAEYRTRVIVRKPANQDDFSGTVLVEWFNVSAIEAAPDWGYINEEIGREGHVYIGVSAQAQGVNGGDTLLEVEVDAGAAEDLGAEGSVDKSGLKNIDPERYGTLVHPGDAYAFDMVNQVGRAASEGNDTLLGAFEPTQVIAVGESQSAIFLSTLVNAVHPLDPVFDGFLIHSRGANVAPLSGDFMSSAESADAEEAIQQGVRIRTDLDVPVFIFEAEGDLLLLGYVHARQPDTDHLRVWEMAGTSHADAQTLRSILGGPRDPSVGSILGCSGPINTGPHKEGVQAALHHLVEWAAGGPPPPAGSPIEVVEGDDPSIARDEHGIALGGVRNPLVDVPVATLTGDPPGGAGIEDLVSGEGGICVLFGQTIPFEPATIQSLYPTFDQYLAEFRASADEMVAAGYLLQPDADALIADAEGYRPLFD